MQLSIVIVNYNVKYFLKQCLASVFGSDKRLADGSELELDVWVVDNDSVDGSVEMVRSDFPQVHMIENHENVGFAKANNMALKQATGDLLLLLNPDTVVERDTFVQCADFMATHSDCGGLTVKMVDGKGNYLRESKRGFPSPQASFYKIIGLTRLFPRSRRFAAYYMGHLGEDDINPFVFFIDEVHRYAKSKYSEKEFHGGLTLLAREGRKKGIFLYLTTQNPKDVSPVLFGQIGTLLIHRLMLNDEIRAVESHLDDYAIKHVRKLNQGEVILSSVNLLHNMFIHVDKCDRIQHNMTPHL